MTTAQQASGFLNTVLLTLGCKGGSLCLSAMFTIHHFIGICHWLMKLSAFGSNMAAIFGGIVVFIKLFDPSFRTHVIYKYWLKHFKNKKK